MITSMHRSIPEPNYGSDSCSSCLVHHRKNTLVIEEPKTKTKLWYQWFNVRIRRYMILEIFFFISLTLILYRLQTISNQNNRVLEMGFSMQSQFGAIERKVEMLISRKSNSDKSQFENTKPLEESIADVLKNMKFSTQDSKVEPIVSQQSTSKTEESTLKVSNFKKSFLFNAADFLKGASVDMDHSSSSNLNPLIGYDQSNLVLLDRPQLLTDKAWCSNAENPVLTINLAKYIKPISVSYEHAHWEGIVPNGAPRTYDVAACLDFYCEKWKPLVSNCEYSQYGSNEQMCNISSHMDVPLIGKVQFRFRENYGGTKMTCVHLVRVYGEAKTPAKIEEKNLRSEEICTDLRWYYHNSYFKYIWANKNCTVLYENNCCLECPECCQECLITDYNRKTFESIGLYTLLVVVTVIISFFVILTLLSILFSCIPFLRRYIH